MNPGTGAVLTKSDPKSSTNWLWLGLRAELVLFRRPMFVLSVLAIVLVPSLYAVFYISSFWDPYGHLDRLPAALVNNDRGVIRGGRNVNLGNTVVNMLKQHPPFHFVRLPSAEAADEALRRGEVYFALIISSDFSERAITARQDRPAEFTLRVADGSKAAVVGEEKLEAGINQLVAGGERLDQGAEELRQGAAKVPFGGHRLSAGTAQIEAGIATLDTNLVLVAAGGRQLNAGLEQLNDGIQPLTGGMLQLETGLDTMIAQLPSADPDGHGTTAASQLRNGGEELTNGLARLRAGSHQLVEGSKELEAGTANLALGLNRLHTSFSEEFGDADGGGLAAPVRMNIETSDPVPNNGTGFSPYFASLTLWLGGIMITFVFHCRRLIEPMRGAPRWVCWFAKAAVPLGLGGLQATFVVAVLRMGFGIAFVHPCLVWLAAILGSLAFVAVIVLLIAVLGDAGRLPAVVLLILQLASAGGVYPVELSGRFYEAIHPFMPFTALVTAFRATMFGAYDGAWLVSAVQLAVTGGSAAILAIWFARWKYIPRDSYGPAVEFS